MKYLMWFLFVYWHLCNLIYRHSSSEIFGRCDRSTQLVQLAERSTFIMHTNSGRSHNVMRFFLDCILPCIFRSSTFTACRHQSNSAVSIIQQMESHFFHHFWSCQRNIAEHAFKVLIKPETGKADAVGKEMRRPTSRIYVRACFHNALHYGCQCELKSDECHPKESWEYIWGTDNLYWEW